jgi:hypothetical protein
MTTPDNQQPDRILETTFTDSSKSQSKPISVNYSQQVKVAENTLKHCIGRKYTAWQNCIPGEDLLPQRMHRKLVRGQNLFNSSKVVSSVF